MIKIIFRESWRLVLKNRKFIFLLWGTNVALALVLTIPVFSMLQEFLQHSNWSNLLALNFNYFWLEQFLNSNKNIFDKLPLLFMSIIGINVLLQQLYQGGLIAVLNNPKKNHISDFFYSGVKFWYRFVKVSLIVLLTYILLFIVNTKIDALILSVTQKINSVSLDLLLRTIKYLVLLFLIGIISLFSEYVRIYIVLKDIVKIWKAVKYILVFLRQKFVLVFTVFFLVSLIGAAGAVIYNLVAILIPRSPFYFLILTFILQQMLIIFRLVITMFLYATEVYIFTDQDAEIIYK
jgi:hypothetical protein